MCPTQKTMCVNFSPWSRLLWVSMATPKSEYPSVNDYLVACTVCVCVWDFGCFCSEDAEREKLTRFCMSCFSTVQLLHPWWWEKGITRVTSTFEHSYLLLGWFGFWLSHSTVVQIQRSLQCSRPKSAEIKSLWAKVKTIASTMIIYIIKHWLINVWVHTSRTSVTYPVASTKPWNCLLVTSWMSM